MSHFSKIQQLIIFDNLIKNTGISRKVDYPGKVIELISLYIDYTN